MQNLRKTNLSQILERIDKGKLTPTATHYQVEESPDGPLDSYVLRCPALTTSLVLLTYSKEASVKSQGHIRLCPERAIDYVTTKKGGNPLSLLFVNDISACDDTHGEFPVSLLRAIAHNWQLLSSSDLHQVKW